LHGGFAFGCQQCFIFAPSYPTLREVTQPLEPFLIIFLVPSLTVHSFRVIQERQTRRCGRVEGEGAFILAFPLRRQKWVFQVVKVARVGRPFQGRRRKQKAPAIFIVLVIIIAI
jgi:hypothetical protein